MKKFFCFLLLLFLSPVAAQAEEVRVKDLGRFLGWRDNPLVGYGIVTGLAGSGDSPRNPATRQALGNVLARLGVNIPAELIQSRNVAVVVVTATLPPSANIGDRIDANITSIGDARSLVGGTLLMTPLLGPDQRSYALAQGALVVGGYQFQAGPNLRQRNYPTAAIVSNGATVETAISANLVGTDGRLTFVLKNPDVTTAQRIADGLNASFGYPVAQVRGADAVLIAVPANQDVNRTITQIETVSVRPDQLARIVINERTGTVVGGGNVQISSVVISQGDIKVSVSRDYESTQPYDYGYRYSDPYGLIVTNTRLDVVENESDVTVKLPSSTVTDLVQALNRAKVGTRNIIAILQAIKAAGALHADIVIQ